MKDLILINGGYYYENHIPENIEKNILNIYKNIKNPSEEHQIIFSGNNGDLINKVIQENFSIDSKNSKYIQYFSSEHEPKVDEYEMKMLDDIISSFMDKKILTIISNYQKINYFITFFQKRFDTRNLDLFEDIKKYNEKIHKEYGLPDEKPEIIGIKSNIFKEVFYADKFEGIHYNISNRTHRTIPKKSIDD